MSAKTVKVGLLGIGEMGAAIATLYFFSGQAAEPVLYVLPLAVLTLSDAAAALAGSSYGRMRYTIEEGQKSIKVRLSSSW